MEAPVDPVSIINVTYPFLPFPLCIHDEQESSSIESVLSGLRRANFQKKKDGAKVRNYLPVITTEQWREHKRLELKQKEEENLKKLEKQRVREMKKIEKEK